MNLSISQDRKPSIRIVTEAGIVGMIGLNTSGVGVTFKAFEVLVFGE